VCKTAIVTGSSSGLGLAIKEALVNLDWSVFSYDRSEGDDIIRPSGWVSELNHLDLLVNCAGINHNEWFEDVSCESLEHVMEVNAFGIVYMTQACLHALKKSLGTVINIVSNAAHIPMTSSLAYNMSKAAALMATKQMAHELTPKYGITVFSVSPNKLRGTGMSKQIEENVCRVRGWTPEYAAAYQKKALMHGLETEPRDVADFIANLVTTGQSKFMSGCDIPFGK
jgi:NAD(P)-dependent dehydrogenase (short-subunit alcohol dehydrogenase family)